MEYLYNNTFILDDKWRKHYACKIILNRRRTWIFSVFFLEGYYLFAIFQPIIFSVVPFMTEKFVKSTKKEAYQYFNKIFKYFLLGASFITLVLIFVSDLIFKHFLIWHFMKNYQIIIVHFISY
jgi:hypothetical protein